MKETIIFTGHINLGEKITPEIVNIVNKAKNENNKLLIFIGDIDFESKVINYIKKGKEGIIQNYLKRLECNDTGCVLSQLPKNEKEIDKNIDFNCYQEIEKYIFNKHNTLLNEMKNTDFKIDKNKKVYSIFKKIIDTEIKPMLIKKIIDNYNVNNLIIITEKKIRNKVRHKLSLSRNKNWGQIIYKKNNEIFIDDNKIMNTKGNVLCRGIIFGLYEYIAENQYKEVKHFIEEKHFLSIYKGWELYVKFQSKIKHLNNNIEKVEFIID
jgi:hypothetical protein